MGITKSLLGTLLLACAASWIGASPALAQTKPAPAAAAASAAEPKKPAPNPGIGTQYSEKGADTCLYCHDAEADTATFTAADLFKSKHARPRDIRGPFGQGHLQCEACHGPGANHSVKDNDKIFTTISHKPNSFLKPSQLNETCLTCHKGSQRNAWHEGGHGRVELACSSCHQIHTGKDKVLAKATEAEVCFKCHKQQRADFQKASAHPVRFGRMACSDCHNAHGSGGQAMLRQPTLNQTCFSCHAEKRGPLLWEHAPVAEDCSLCHTSHGSVRQALLNKPAPLLCQQCHTAAGHPAVPRTAAGLPGGSAGGAIFISAGSCMNCHSQVHGSNHPAGVKLMR